MTSRLIFLFIVLLYSDGLAAAQSPSSAPPSPENYESLLSKLTAGWTNIDYNEIRLAYSRTKDAGPYGADHDVRRQMEAAALENRCDEAIKIADSILARFYLSPDTHAAESSCYRVAGNNTKADFHKAVYLGLINSILAKGDGGSPETAYTVITIEEAFAVMRALGFTVWGQGYEHKDAHTFDVLSGTDDRNKRSAKVYFNVDIPLAIEKRRPSPKP